MTIDSPPARKAPAAPAPSEPESDETALPSSPAPAQPKKVSSPSASLAGVAALAEGTEIGTRYRVLKLLGRGGMGAVYLCRDEELQRDVALKVIRPEIAADPSVLDRFKREIQLSSRVTHRNVLRSTTSARRTASGS